MPLKKKSAKRKTSARKRARPTAKSAPRKKNAAKKAQRPKRKAAAKAAKPKPRRPAKTVAKRPSAPRRGNGATATATPALSLIDGLILQARKAGADAADAVLVESAALSV